MQLAARAPVIEDLEGEPTKSSQQQQAECRPMWSRALKAPRVLRRFKISLSSARRLCAGVRLGFKRKHGLSGNGIAIRIRPEPGRIRPNRSPESQLWKVVGEEAKTINNRWDVFIFVRLLSAPLPRDTFSSLRMTSINLNSLSETEVSSLHSGAVISFF